MLVEVRSLILIDDVLGINHRIRAEASKREREPGSLDTCTGSSCETEKMTGFMLELPDGDLDVSGMVSMTGVLCPYNLNESSLWCPEQNDPLFFYRPAFVDEEMDRYLLIVDTREE